MNIHSKPAKARIPGPRATLMALAAVVMVSAAASVPAYAENNGQHSGQNNRNNGKPYDRGDRYGYGKGYGPDRYGHNHVYRSYDYQNNGRYSYGPPPVVHAPYAPPAIEFIFPVRIR